MVDEKVDRRATMQLAGDKLEETSGIGLDGQSHDICKQSPAVISSSLYVASGGETLFCSTSLHFTWRVSLETETLISAQRVTAKSFQKS
jgi:hypothetical protein